MRILIVGGGIGGLALAAHLKSTNHDVTIVEKANKWKHVGYFLGLWTKEMNTLEKFHIQKKLKQYSHYSKYFTLLNKQGEIIKKLPFDHLIESFGPAFGILRADFHTILLSLVKGIPMKLNTSVTNLEELATTVKVTFTDKTQSEFDVVVGADGIHSQVRKLLLGNVRLRYFGMTYWFYMVSHIIPSPRFASEIWEDGRFFGVYPLNNKKLCIMFAKSAPANYPDPPQTRIQSLKESFRDFGWIVPDILNSMKDPEEIFHDDWNEVFIHTWHKGRVVLLGDAAHGTLPTLGIGAAMALEDAFVLAEELNTIDTLQAPLALKRYFKKRKERVASIRKQSEFIGNLMKLQNPAAVFMRDHFLRTIPDTLVQEYLEHVLTTHPFVQK